MPWPVRTSMEEEERSKEGRGRADFARKAMGSHRTALKCAGCHVLPFCRRGPIRLQHVKLAEKFYVADRRSHGSWKRRRRSRGIGRLSLLFFPFPFLPSEKFPIFRFTWNFLDRHLQGCIRLLHCPPLECINFLEHDMITSIILSNIN